MKSRNPEFWEEVGVKNGWTDGRIGVKIKAALQFYGFQLFTCCLFAGANTREQQLK